MRTHKILPAFCALLLFASVAAAQEVDSFFPDCGSQGDAVVIRGSGFAEEPSVRFGDTDAVVIRSRENAVLVRLPEGLSVGEVSITVDGAAAGENFNVLEDDAPVVLRISATTAIADQPILIIGRRLGGATATFIDSEGADAATVELRGGRRARVFRVPEDLAAGTYTLRVENEDGADSGACSPEIEIVETGEATLNEADPSNALPGAFLTLKGTDLSPTGPCRVQWDDGSGELIERLGFSNGFDTVRTRVPGTVAQGTTYTVKIDLRGDAPVTNGIEYTVGTPEAPSITELDPDAGPTDSLFAVKGEDLLVLGSKTTVEFSDGDTTVEARILAARPGFFKRGDELLVRVPSDLADGEYDVRVKVGSQLSDPATYTVGALPLSVTDMNPKSQGTRGSFRPVFIEGTGFGQGGPDATPLAVEWDDGDTARAGRVIFRSDRLLVALVPGDRRDPLPVGTYTVNVTLDPDGSPETVEAGTYTVE